MMNWETLLNSSRRRETTVPKDHRSQFERDYGRCVFSTPVKRLQDKAQVFPLEAHDGVRTRLTHSLEVSSVARGLGVTVAQWLDSEKFLIARDDETTYDVQRSIESICATCGLIHDLGNPPFGHAGEYAIQTWFLGRYGRADDGKIEREVAVSRLKGLGLTEQQGLDLLDFDGNAQTIRLVSKLQVLADFYGLNLTWGTLSALCKYTASSVQVDKRSQSRKKPGHFASENELVREIREKTGVGEARNPLTFLVEAADDIVYSVADVEDAVKKDVLSWRTLEELLVASKCDHLQQVLEQKAKILKPSGKAEKDLRNDVQAAAFRTAAIIFMTDAVVDVFKENYQQIMTGTYDHALIDESRAASLAKCLTKGIGQKFVYVTPATLKLELMGRNTIHDLMSAFWEGIQELEEGNEPKKKDFSGKAVALLSSNYKEVFDNACSLDSGSRPYFQFQLLTDYISGMTDTYCKELHQELFNG